MPRAYRDGVEVKTSVNPAADEEIDADLLESSIAAFLEQSAASPKSFGAETRRKSGGTPPDERCDASPSDVAAGDVLHSSATDPMAEEHASASDLGEADSGQLQPLPQAEDGFGLTEEALADLPQTFVATPVIEDADGAIEDVGLVPLCEPPAATATPTEQCMAPAQPAGSVRINLTAVNALEDILTSRASESKSLGMKMRCLELQAIGSALETAQTAIAALSSSRGPHPDETWKAAARWSLKNVDSGAVVPYLEALGFKPSCEEQWWDPPEVSGTTLELCLQGHTQHADHTWYDLDCKINHLAAAASSTEWPAPRRLAQLRLDLHDPVKASLAAAYTTHFAASPFAKTGGPPGTTARLRAWLQTLCRVINSGAMSPRDAALVLLFLQAPLPQHLHGSLGVAAAAGGALSGLGEAEVRMDGAESESWDIET
eukprot:CAMPEP_0115590860 /NCGR_PEP_ID=MMETSP0272-20121206/9981_1 /TAXON_ID=71861 /ORGANISM="Scrippsiella trochoidea, Strain CCMP3099" /LENGTH=430 /DNA_ID=CAMNT_0003026067 /DNA_START=21 /DNA_END=1311 /DNA_ORIENTATION=-